MTIATLYFFITLKSYAKWIKFACCNDAYLHVSNIPITLTYNLSKYLEVCLLLNSLLLGQCWDYDLFFFSPNGLCHDSSSTYCTSLHFHALVWNLHSIGHDWTLEIIRVTLTWNFMWCTPLVACRPCQKFRCISSIIL